jgi:ring-1,2-phenylacetyl-CoA epoxidase subunit PaaC
MTLGICDGTPKGGSTSDMTMQITAASPLFEVALGLADDHLVLGHRLSQWVGRAPTLEEELALANIGLDLIGAARSLYTYAGEVEGRGRDEDQLAYLRNAGEFRNLLIAELRNGDFAATIVRQLCFSAFMVPYWEALGGSRDTTLAAIAARSLKESRYHVRHASEWLIRLGDGTEESRRRTAAALAEVWPYTAELFAMTPAETTLLGSGTAVDRATIREPWEHMLAPVLREATLARPTSSWGQTGGRTGRHTEHLGVMLAEMQVLQRTYPGAKW